MGGDKGAFIHQKISGLLNYTGIESALPVYFLADSTLEFGCVSLSCGTLGADSS